MKDENIYSASDCSKAGDSSAFKNKVVITNEGLPYFCSDENSTVVSAVSLADGEIVQISRDDILGVLKPERLTESARLRLSQIRPGDALDLNEHESQYSGYCFLPDGRYAAGVWLCNAKEALDYVEMQKSYQHRVMICDRDDFAVFEMIDGKIIYPTEKMLREFADMQDGMNFNL